MRYLILMLILSKSSILIGQINNNRTDKKYCIEEYFNEINNIETLENNNDGLIFLKETIGDKRIVLLGEGSHFDGTTRKSKNKIIKFLHEEMGFNILLEEHGMIETNRAWKDIIEKRDSAVGVFCWLTEFFSFRVAESNYYLAKYIEQMEKTNPLILAGVDINECSTLSTTFYKELEDFILYQDSSFNKKGIYEKFLYISQKGKKSRSWKKFHTEAVSSRKLDKLEECTRELIDYINGLKTISQSAKNREILFFIQALKSRLNEIKWVSLRDEDDGLFEYHKLRDKYMKENLEWYLKEYYPNQKIIVSMSTYHLSKNLDLLKPTPKDLNKVKPMWDYVNEKIKKETYSIAFVTHHGVEGKGMSFTSKIKTRKKNSIEGILHQLGKTAGFLDLKRIKLCNGMEEYSLFPTFSRAYQADWSEIYDGIFFIDEMKINQLFLFEDRLDLKMPHNLPKSWYR